MNRYARACFFYFFISDRIWQMVCGTRHRQRGKKISTRDETKMEKTVRTRSDMNNCFFFEYRVQSQRKRIYMKLHYYCVTIGARCRQNINDCVFFLVSNPDERVFCPPETSISCGFARGSYKLSRDIPTTRKLGKKDTRKLDFEVSVKWVKMAKGGKLV